jgi:hypothetical protein
MVHIEGRDFEPILVENDFASSWASVISILNGAATNGAASMGANQAKPRPLSFDSSPAHP